MGKDYVRKELEDKLDELSAIEKNALKELTKLPKAKFMQKEEEKIVVNFFGRRIARQIGNILKNRKISLLRN